MKKVIQTQGTRKTAVARATLTAGKGNVHVNNQLLDNYANEMIRLRIQEPLILAGETAKAIDIDIRCHGGGVNGQIDAIRLATAGRWWNLTLSSSPCLRNTIAYCLLPTCGRTKCPSPTRVSRETNGRNHIGRDDE